MTFPLRIDSALVYPWSKALADKWSFVDRFNEPYNLFHRSGEEIWLPRGLWGQKQGDKDERDPGKPVKFLNLFTPRSSDQQRVVDESAAFLHKGTSHILQAPTGYGKTFVGCAIAARILRRTLVITTKEDIIDQWRKAAKAVLGLADADIGVWRADTVPSLDQPFVIALVQSVMKGPERYGHGPYTGFGLVICDEVHRMAAEQFSQCMWWLPAKLRLGLSATPYRKDGRDQVFRLHIGPVQVSAEMEVMVPKIIAEYTTWKVPKVFGRHGNVQPLPHEPGRTMLVNKDLAKNNARNMRIVEFVKLCRRKGRNIIVFSDLLDHLRILYDMMVDAGVSAPEIGYYVGSTNYSGSSAERQRERELVKKLPVILATYSMASEATDIPWLDTCVLATPRSDVVQIVGRIRREYPEKREPVVYDLIDRDSPILGAYWGKRLRWYKSLGAPVVGPVSGA
jgi:superfamily II DNA or RNA helicase